MTSEEIRAMRRGIPEEEEWMECVKCGITFHTLYSIGRDDHFSGRCTPIKEPFRRS